MTLRNRLLLAQLPIALALTLIGVLSVFTVDPLGRAGKEILAGSRSPRTMSPSSRSSRSTSAGSAWS